MCNDCIYLKRKPGHCSRIYDRDTPKDIDLLTIVICLDV